MSEECRMIDVGDLNPHVQDDIRTGAFLERELTTEERRILESRYVEVWGSTRHHGIWFLGEAESIDIQRNTLSLLCYRCSKRHQIDMAHVTLVRR